MTPAHTSRAHAYFQANTGFSFEQLIAPLDASTAAAAPAGTPLRGGPVYHAIEQARRHDDASLPMGAWEHQLRQADWQRVAGLAAHALTHDSKDLQLAAWLLQAQVHRTGVDALAPGFSLLQQLCARYWQALYPADDEHRANIFRRLNEKLLPDLRLLPLTSGEPAFALADWERARRQEQLRQHGGEQVAVDAGPDLAGLAAAVAATPAAFYLDLQARLDEALISLDALAGCLDEQFGEDSPSLSALAAVLQQMRDVAAAALQARGA
ncbi:type VI secretion system protein TssA [Janthinobacterium sp. 1_2014MBL_MicDiv]|uniref:type VI secretion system protein TssA n=1 Tax=Janthinobacterium sp. 1_2014MBL_MicDiv TaxID=1644131 RepID=UPI0008F48C58|nr:type VI secretion system protein TssA [Janthinobacterium sp. 1_2014MBL_MicDiv]